MPAFGVTVSMVGNTEPGRSKCGMEDDRAVALASKGVHPRGTGLSIIVLEARTRVGSSLEAQEGLKKLFASVSLLSVCYIPADQLSSVLLSVKFLGEKLNLGAGVKLQCYEVLNSDSISTSL